jgi:CTP-dependent riboflavin kinase
MAQPHYQNQFKSVLGAGAWPGTLNIDLYGDNLLNYKGLRVLAGLEEGESAESAKPIRIQGFERSGRSFGGATAFKAEISRGGDDWISCAILIPDLTRHTQTAEVISPSFLREALPCEDGDEVDIRLS